MVAGTESSEERAGPLQGLTVIELGGIGPLPFAGMTLAGMGADVIRIDRPGGEPLNGSGPADLLNRGKRSVALNLKQPAAVQVVLALAQQADAVIEGWRPGVAERLGIGPEACQAANPRLVYGRMTGWGQTGPLAQSAGHDIDYVALTGALHAIGPAGGAPSIPLNLVGDFGGGATYLVMGVLAAVLEARATGAGRIVDAAIVDGAAHLLTVVHALLAAGRWQDTRQANLLDGGMPFYAVYETSDGAHMAVGAIEPQFYREFVRLLGASADPAAQHDPRQWGAARREFARLFATRSLAEWNEVFEGHDACVAPVLSLRAAAEHPHVAQRGVLVTRDGVLQAGPAPRFSGPAPAAAGPPARVGLHTREVLAEFKIADVEGLLASGAAVA